jgi:hypothetical protein
MNPRAKFWKAVIRHDNGRSDHFDHLRDIDRNLHHQSEEKLKIKIKKEKKQHEIHRIQVCVPAQLQ